MDRAERIGLGTALAGHLALFGVLSLGLLSHSKPLPKLSDPMEVSLTGPVAPLSASPEPAKEAPAPSEAPDQGQPEDAAPPPPPAPEPQPKPQTAAPAKPAPMPPEPKPVPAAKPSPAPKPPAKAQPTPAKAAAAAKPAPGRPRLTPDFLKDLPDTGNGKSSASAKPKATGSRLGKDFLKGIADSPGKAATPRAAMTGAQVAALAALLREQLRPYWAPPAGTGVTALNTTLRLHLSQAGALTASPDLVGTSGVTDANRIYVRQHQDAARRAVARAAPFRGLPAEFYDDWKVVDVDFNNRLSQ